MDPRRNPRTALLAALALLPACTTEYAVRDADLEVEEILEEIDRTQIASRVESLVQPEPNPAPSPGAETGDAPQPPSEPTPRTLRLDLREAIRLAVRQSRDYQTQVESLYLQALALSGTRRDFSPQLSGILSYVFADADRILPSYTGSAGVSASQILPLGGTVTLSGDQNVAGAFDSGDDLYDAALSLSYQQNLLRGVGYEASHDALIQAERSIVYAARDFELFRQDFSVDVARRFYDLVAQQRVVENTRTRTESARHTLAQSEALHRVGQLNRVELYRAQEEALSSENSLLTAEQSFEDALDAFKILLALPTEAHLEIEPDEPEFVPVDMTLASAIGAAEANRLDFKTTGDQREDALRSVRIASQGLRADLDLNVAAVLSSPPEPHLRDQQLSNTSFTAGVTLGLPLDRKDERNAYRSALIGLDRARRSYELARDNLALEVRSSLRELRRSATSLDIQRRTIESEDRRLRIATIQFRAGNVSNRDVVEAEQGLLDARNSEIGERVDYEIARLRLLRTLGTLVLDDEGLWIEGS